MNQGEDETKGRIEAVEPTVVLGWDEVFGLHLQVRGGREEARRVVDLLSESKVTAHADGESEGSARLRRDGFERVMLGAAARSSSQERELRGLLLENGSVVTPPEGVESVPCPYGERLRPLLRRGGYFEGTERPTAAELGLGAEDGPELLRMAEDPEFDHSWLQDAAWAPVWAWFLLGELKPAGATELLLGALNRIDREDGDEAASAVLPQVFGMIGRDVAPALEAVVRDEARGIWSRWAAASGLGEIACACPEARGEVVGVLTALLEERASLDAEVNAAIVDELIKLKAVESAGAIEGAFRANLVDETITGDWDEVQVELGLKEAPTVAPGISFHGAEPVRREGPKVGRNDPCPCGSGKKFKKCCGG